MPAATDPSVASWPDIYRAEAFGRAMALNVPAVTSSFLDHVQQALLDLVPGRPDRSTAVRALGGTYGAAAVASAWDGLEAAGLFTMTPAPVPTDRYGPSKALTLTLNVAQHCNLECAYCYIDDEVLRTRAAMPVATARAAVDFVLDRHPDAESFGVSFYGGEPLLNFAVIKEAMLYANEAAADRGLPAPEFHVSTNGTVLNDTMVDFLATQPVNVLVSLDGDAATHDGNRRFRGGRATHERVRRAVERLKAAGGPLTVSASAVISPGNRLIDAYLYLRAIGFDEIKASYVRYHDAATFGLDDQTRQEYLDDLATIALDYVDQLRAGERPAFYEFNRRVLHLWSRTRRVEFCPAAVTRYGVGHDGAVHPCGPAVSMGDSRLGTVHDGIDDGVLDGFLAQNDIFASASCRSCWARFLCGGGCPLPLVRGTAENCAITEHTTRLALYIFLTIAEENPLLLAALLDEDILRQIRQQVLSVL